ncbi:hypothetical protein D3C76_1276850 [compost metagenome]
MKTFDYYILGCYDRLMHRHFVENCEMPILYFEDIFTLIVTWGVIRHVHFVEFTYRFQNYKITT